MAGLIIRAIIAFIGLCIQYPLLGFVVLISSIVGGGFWIKSQIAEANAATAERAADRRRNGSIWDD